MKTLLKIQSSLAGSQGQSSMLADQFVERWMSRNPDGRVIVRDLSRDAIPHLTAERFAAFLAKPETRTQDQLAIVAQSDALIDELRAADTIVLAVPMYNFGVPSTLRSYFDHIARAGVTFRYTSAGPEGLLKGKEAYVFVSRGGVYNGAADTQTPYLQQFLGFIGITDVKFVYAQGLGMGQETRERSLSDAAREIDALFESEALAA
jgi:FMN-dependent NADH-azoreductase